MDAELLSMDAPFRGEFAKLGGKVAPESLSLGSAKNKVPSHMEGRRLMRLPALNISMEGEILPKPAPPPGPPPKVTPSAGSANSPKPGGGSSSPSTQGGTSSSSTPGGGKSPTKAYEGVADRTPIHEGGPSARGEAIAGGMQLGFQGVNLIIQAINDSIQAGRVKAAMAKLEPAIAAKLHDDPSQGVLIVVRYSRREKVGAEVESPLEHVAVFEGIDVGYGYTESEALYNLGSTPRISAVGSGQTLFERHFIPPTRPLDAMQLHTPFPKIGLATFVPGRERLQDVRFRGIWGFDDASETKLKVNPGTTPQFLFLEAPTSVAFFNGRMRMETDIELAWMYPAELSATPVKSALTLPFVELDTTNWLFRPFFPTRAGMIFPADAATARLFQTTSPTGDKGTLPYPNMHLVRWVRRENVRLLRDFRLESRSK
jgi:hypothetical protein